MSTGTIANMIAGSHQRLEVVVDLVSVVLVAEAYGGELGVDRPR